VSRRLAIAALPALLLCAACSSEGNSAYGQFYQIARQSMAASFGNARVTREQATAIPYASIGYSIDHGNENILVLATDNNGEQLWTSASHVVVVTHDGRIVRSLGLDHDLAGTTFATDGQSPPPAAAIKSAFTSTRQMDFPELGLYGVIVSCRASAQGRQTIKILGQILTTVRVDETCESRSRNWAFVDTFWVDPDNGLVWRSQQHIHPKGGVIEIETFRPPG
jgi:hypothetical protein